MPRVRAVKSWNHRIKRIKPDILDCSFVPCPDKADFRYEFDRTKRSKQRHCRYDYCQKHALIVGKRHGLKLEAFLTHTNTKNEFAQ